jgi:hypothetical protein
VQNGDVKQMDKQKELIELFGQNYNNVNNLKEYLNKKYHPKYFNTFKEFCKHISLKNESIEDYTDDYISKDDSCIIILFDDYRDSYNSTESDNFSDDIIVCFDKNTKKIIKYYYTGLESHYLQDIDSFMH